MPLGGSLFRRFVMYSVVAFVVAACGAFGGGEDERPLESFTAEELYKRAEFELESESNSAEAARLLLQPEARLQ